MARRQREKETLILSITSAAEKMDIEPRRLRYLIQKHHLKPVPRLDSADKRCTYYAYTNLLSIAR